MPIPLILFFGGDQDVTVLLGQGEIFSICREHQNRDIMVKV